MWHIIENSHTCLLNKTSLNSKIALQLLSELGEAWIINEAGQLYKEYKFNNFIDAMKFANKVAEIAELENHHPI